jgi:Polyketide cyclase / dehydrase and lipid transport
MTDEAHEQIHVDAEPSRCFALASGFEDYPTWAKDVKQATVLTRDHTGRGTRVEYRAAALGRSVRYVLDYDFTDAPASFAWVLVEGDMLRALDGRYAFAPDGTGTRVDYDLRVDLSVPMPGLIRRRASGIIMGTALKELKLMAERPSDPRVPSEPGVPSEPAPADAAAPDAGAPTAAADPAPDAPPASHPPHAPHPDSVDFDAAGTEERSLPAPSIIECAVTELLGAVPEVRDHVLEAADALLDAAKALLDAADRVVRQQRADG